MSEFAENITEGVEAAVDNASGIPLKAFYKTIKGEAGMFESKKNGSFENAVFDQICKLNHNLEQLNKTNEKIAAALVANNIEENDRGTGIHVAVSQMDDVRKNMVFSDVVKRN